MPIPKGKSELAKCTFHPFLPDSLLFCCTPIMNPEPKEMDHFAFTPSFGLNTSLLSIIFPLFGQNYAGEIFSHFETIGPSNISIFVKCKMEGI